MRIIFLLGVLFAMTLSAAAQSAERYYCTQYGPFFLRFDGDKAAGFFAVLKNDDLGAVVGVLDGYELSGNWIETGGKGPIRMTFSEDWSSFEAEYAVAPDTENWISGWTGYLPPAGDPAVFDIDGESFRCR